MPTFAALNNDKKMKKLFLAGAVALFGFASAQTTNAALAKGKWVIEANTGSHATGNTSFGLTSVDGANTTSWNLGVDGGYFVMDKLAIKAGLGYGETGVDGVEGNFVYKVGAQYYIINQIPVGVDFTGTSSDGDNANWVGFEGGYAWFVAPNIAVTPKLRYNLTLDENKAPSAFQGLIGFSLFF